MNLISKIEQLKGILVFITIIALFHFNLIYTINIYGQTNDTGSITIDADQDKVKVYINGKFFGVASGSSEIDNLSPDEYIIKIEKENFQIWERSVKVEKNKNNILEIILKKEESVKSEKEYRYPLRILGYFSFGISVCCAGVGYYNNYLADKNYKDSLTAYEEYKKETMDFSTLWGNYKTKYDLSKKYSTYRNIFYILGFND